MSTEYKVYVHTNTANGKKYFGITRQKTTKRWQNGSGYHGCTYFERAIKKYGWASFLHEIVAENLTADEAKKLERELITANKTYLPEYGYNISLGGDGETKYFTEEEAKEALRKQRHECYLRHKDKYKQWKSDFLEKHPDYNKKYREEHKQYFHDWYLSGGEELKEKYREYSREYYKKNPEKAKEACRKYREAHREEHKQYMKEYHRKRKEALANVNN